MVRDGDCALRCALTLTPPDQYITLQHLCLSSSVTIETKGAGVVDVVLSRPMREAEPCGKVAKNRR